jgi:hypothetical protein
LFRLYGPAGVFLGVGEAADGILLARRLLAQPPDLESKRLE